MNMITDDEDDDVLLLLSGPSRSNEPKASVRVDFYGSVRHYFCSSDRFLSFGETFLSFGAISKIIMPKCFRPDPKINPGVYLEVVLPYVGR